MSKKMKMASKKEWRIGVELTLRGTVIVEAATAEEAKERALEDVQIDPTLELVDYEIGTPKEHR